jgi:hypothetical protein
MHRNLRAQAVFCCGFFLVLLLTHAPVLDLPYFWDELGQFVPAALDIQRDGAWVPKSTLPNVHPPGAMAYLASVWSVFGYSVTITRIAMLALAAAGVLGTFLLAIELCRDTSGAPALSAVLLLLASPLFWAQSMMAQLDMPAMVFTMFGLLLFLQERYLASAAVCTLLVLTKETSIVVPAVLGACLLRERRMGAALWFVMPALGLAAWLLVLYKVTGHIFGNPEFTHYNTTFQFHPVRMPLTIVRRLFYIFVDNFHFVGTIAIWVAWNRTRLFRSREWRVVFVVGTLQTIVVSVLGGAALERYLMPVIPLFYIATAAVLTTLTRVRRLQATAVMTAGLTLCIFVSSPLAYPFENNSAFVTFVRLQQKAAEVLEARYSPHKIYSAWPLPDALRRPEFGYVTRPLRVSGLPNFDPDTVLEHAASADVLVIYSRTWEPRWGLLQFSWIQQFLGHYYFYKPQITGEEIMRSLGLIRAARWEERDQWIEIYARTTPDQWMIL